MKKNAKKYLLVMSAGVVTIVVNGQAILNIDNNVLYKS